MTMPKWYYDLEELKATPSVMGGMEYSTEQRYRKEGARFIINVGTRMGLSNDTLATGVVFFHRFYMFHSFATFPRFVTACCCLFLAGKVEETPKKCKDIIKTARTHLTPQQFSQFGDDPKEEVMTLERILLQTIRFDLQVDHPYKYLLKYAKSLKGDKEKLQDMVQMAWTFINDSLCTTLCLQWEPEIIGIALMYLAGKFTKFEITDWDGRTAQHKYWWDMFVENMNTNFLEDICHQFLDNYGFQDPETPCDSPSSPLTKKLKRRHSSTRRNSAESCRLGKSKSNSKSLLNGTSTTNSKFVPSVISAPPLLPSHKVHVSSELSSTTLSLQNSSVTTSVASKVAASTIVSATNTHSSAVVHAVSNINMHSNQNHQQELGQVCNVNQPHLAVNEGQQTSTLPTTQAFPLSVPPPLCNNHRVSIYPQQHAESEKFGNQPHNPYLASSAFSGIFPHLTYQQPQSQFYQQPGHQERYYNSTHHASNQQSTYIPPALPPILPSFPVGQSLPPPPQLLPHIISIPPPSMQPPLPIQFVSQPSQNQVQYCANGHSPTMPFPLLQKQISSSNLRFPQPGQGINPILPASGCV